MRNKRLLLLSVLVIGALALAACGGGQPTEAPAAPAAEATVAPTEAPAAETPTEAPAAEAPTEAPTEAPAAEAAASTDCAATLTIWADEQRAPVLLPLGDKLKADTGVCLNLVQKQFGQIRDDLKVAGPAGEGPDILIGAHDWIGELVNSGLLAEVSLGDLTDSFVPEGVAACNYDSKLYCMPYAVENVAFYINPDLVPEAPATWDDVKTLSQEIKAGGAKYGYLIQENDPYHFYPIQTAFGGYVFGKDENGNWNPADVGIGSQGTIDAFTWLDGMYADGLLDRAAGINYDLMSAAFQNGDAAMIIGGPWMLDGFRSAGVPYKVVPLPAGPAGQSKPFLGVQGFMISAFSKQPLVAQTFLQQYVATDETMAAFLEANPRPSAWVAANANLDDDLKAFSESGVGSDAMPNIPQMSAVWSSWRTAMQLVSQGKQTPAEAAAEAQKQIETAIAGN